MIYTAGHINYGGRITDDWDRRCVLTILQDYYNKHVVHSNYQFDLKTKLYHQLPKNSTFDDYINYIATLPLNDEPSIIGFHANAEMSYASAMGNECLRTLLLLQPKEIGEAAMNFDETVISLATEIIKTIPKSFDIREIQKLYVLT